MSNVFTPMLSLVDTFTTHQILEIGKEDTKYYSPVDINFPILKPIHLPNLEWYSFHDLPTKMYITNFDGAIIITATWFDQRPYLCNGPLSGNYSLYQVHFHWGPPDSGGSEHTFSGLRLAMEIHVLFYKNEYLCLAEALDKLDGILCVAYVMELQNEDNADLKPITDHINKLKYSRSKLRLYALSFSKFIKPFKDDYFMYWGNLSDKYNILWLISRKTIPIGVRQVYPFTKVCNDDQETLSSNYRTTYPLGTRLIYHVNPSSELPYLVETAPEGTKIQKKKKTKTTRKSQTTIKSVQSENIST